MSGPSIIFQTNLSFQIICCLYGENIAINILSTLKNADKHFAEYMNKSAYHYAHFLIAYCAYETNNPSWLEDIDNVDVVNATRMAYNYVYTNIKNGTRKNNSNDV